VIKLNLIIIALVIGSFSSAQYNVITSNELTINGTQFFGEDVSVVIQHLGQPNTIEDYYFEIDDVMSQNYNYNGVLFTVISNRTYSFEITGSNYAFTSNNIKVGDNINTLQPIYPLSYANRSHNSLVIQFSDLDRYVLIFFNSNQITEIRLESY